MLDLHLIHMPTHLAAVIQSTLVGDRSRYTGHKSLYPWRFFGVVPHTFRVIDLETMLDGVFVVMVLLS